MAESHLWSEGAAPPLTSEMLQAAIDKVSKQEYTVCVGSNQHVVHPAEWERGGLVRCAACFGVIYIPTPEERE